ncbi:MAG: GNAT family N-acetyltransferase [Gemmatimonas sp.]
MPPEIFDLGQILLRRPTVADAPAIFEYGSDPEVARYADWPVRTTIESLIGSLQDRASEWESGAAYNWVITIPAHDRAIGGVACRVDGHAAEIGFLLHRRYWGQGLSTQAARAVVEWALSDKAIWRVWATCDTENVASARVLEKCELVREGTLRQFAVRPQLSPIPRNAFLYARVRGTT